MTIVRVRTKLRNRKAMCDLGSEQRRGVTKGRFLQENCKFSYGFCGVSI